MTTKQKRGPDGGDTVIRGGRVLPLNSLSRASALTDELLETIETLGEITEFATDRLDVEVGLESNEVSLLEVADAFADDVHTDDVADEIIEALGLDLPRDAHADAQEKISKLLTEKIIAVMKDAAETKLKIILEAEAGLVPCSNGAFALRMDVGALLSRTHEALIEARDKAQEELREIERAAIRAHNEEVRRMTSKPAAAPVAAAPARKPRAKATPAPVAQPAPAAPVAPVAPVAQPAPAAPVAPVAQPAPSPDSDAAAREAQLAAALAALGGGRRRR